MATDSYLDGVKGLQKESSKFNLYHVPYILFELIRKEYALHANVMDVNNHQIVLLDPRKVGFEGVIGFYKHDGGTMFLVWPYYTEDITNAILGPRELLKISAQEKNYGGVYYNEKGDVSEYGVKERLSIRLFHGEYFYLDTTSTDFIISVWQKALDIKRSESYEPEKSFRIKT